MSETRLDILAVGRSSIDLYSNDPGAPFSEISSFGAFVGGSPTNIAVGTKRLGLRSGLLTAVGDGPVGAFVTRFLEKEGVDISFAPRKAGRRTSAVLLGIEPPDRFPLVFYREGCADMELSIDDVLAAPIADAAVVVISGTGLSREPSRSATLLAVERAKAAGRMVVLDLDFRPDQWHDPRAFGIAIRSVLVHVDVAIGTAEELRAGVLADFLVHVSDAQQSSPTVSGDEEAAVARALSLGAGVVVLKRGALGAEVILADGSRHSAAPLQVEVENVLGAGDAFASGFLYGVIMGWSWARCVRLGNATGAIVVGRQGCANFMPTLQEAEDLIEMQGGWP